MPSLCVMCDKLGNLLCSCQDQSARYCSIECQRKDWSTHKLTCIARICGSSIPRELKDKFQRIMLDIPRTIWIRPSKIGSVAHIGVFAARNFSSGEIILVDGVSSISFEYFSGLDSKDTDVAVTQASIMRVSHLFPRRLSEMSPTLVKDIFERITSRSPHLLPIVTKIINAVSPRTQDEASLMEMLIKSAVMMAKIESNKYDMTPAWQKILGISGVVHPIISLINHDNDPNAKRVGGVEHAPDQYGPPEMVNDELAADIKLQLLTAAKSANYRLYKEALCRIRFQVVAIKPIKKGDEIYIDYFGGMCKRDLDDSVFRYWALPYLSE